MLNQQANQVFDRIVVPGRPVAQLQAVPCYLPADGLEVIRAVDRGPGWLLTQCRLATLIPASSVPNPGQALWPACVIAARLASLQD